MSESDKDAIIDSLFCCIRDGIELNYSSWVDWMIVARCLIKEELPDRYGELQHILRCIKVFKRQHDDMGRFTADELLKGSFDFWESMGLIKHDKDNPDHL